MDTTRSEGRAGPPMLTWTLIAVNTAIFGAMVWSGVPLLDAQVGQLEPWGASVVHLVAAGQWWRLLSSMFLHAGIAHLFGNMVTLWLVGRTVERHVGSAALAVIYGFSGLTGGVAMLLTGEVAVGASGGIGGLVGCLVLLALRGYPVRRLLLVLLVLEGTGHLLLSMVPSLSGMRVAHWDHLVAFVAGIAASGLLLLRREAMAGGGTRRWTSIVASLGLVLILVGGAVAHVLHDQMRACSPRVDRLRARLAEVGDRAARVFGEHASIAPSSAFGRPVQGMGPVLRVAAGAVFLDDLPQGQLGRDDTIASVTSSLEILAKYGMLDLTAQSPEAPLYVIAEASMEAQLLIDALRRLPTTVGARLVVRAPQWTPIDAILKGGSAEAKTHVNQLIEAKPEQRPSLISELFLSANRGCQPLVDVWGRIGAAETSAKEGILIRDVPPAIETCSCLGVDVDLLEAGMLVLLAPSGPPVRWLPVRFEDAAGHTEPPITLREGSTVADLAASLGAADSAHRSVYFSRSPAPAPR